MTNNVANISGSDNDLKNACDVMRKGGIILYPTDTVWGIGCDATNPSAIAKVYKLKQRCDSKALIVLLGDENQLHRYVDNIPNIAYELIEASIKPLTIVFEQGRNLCKELCAEDGSIGIRITRERFSQQLCKSFQRPIVSTSANISGTPTPLTFKEINDEIKKGVDYIVKQRQAENAYNQPSSVIKINNDGSFKILRP